MFICIKCPGLFCSVGLPTKHFSPEYIKYSFQSLENCSSLFWDSTGSIQSVDAATTQQTIIVHHFLMM